MELRFGFVSVLLLCLGLCSSCEDERFDTGSTMPDGQFIVDYTAEAGKATRALHENVPAGERQIPRITLCLLLILILRSCGIMVLLLH